MRQVTYLLVQNWCSLTASNMLNRPMLRIRVCVIFLVSPQQQREKVAVAMKSVIEDDVVGACATKGQEKLRWKRRGHFKRKFFMIYG